MERKGKRVGVARMEASEEGGGREKGRERERERKREKEGGWGRRG